MDGRGWEGGRVLINRCAERKRNAEGGRVKGLAADFLNLAHGSTLVVNTALGANAPLRFHLGDAAVRTSRSWRARL